MIAIAEKEVWKDIEGYKGIYQVSSWGNVKSLDRIDSRGWKRKERTIKKQKTFDGYLHVGLYKNGIETKFRVHRLVAEAFISNRKSEVNHIDGDKTNNHVNNLEWVSHDENMKHASKMGVMKSSRLGQAKLTGKDIIFIRENCIKYGGNKTEQELALMFGVSYSQVNKIVNYKSWEHIS
jgi:hypothetical protein